MSGLVRGWPASSGARPPCPLSGWLPNCGFWPYSLLSSTVPVRPQPDGHGAPNRSLETREAAVQIGAAVRPAEAPRRALYARVESVCVLAAMVVGQTSQGAILAGTNLCDSAYRV